ncbi:MAG: CRISPR-associated helicase Cas3' [Verrucomicrobiota bacterium]
MSGAMQTESNAERRLMRYYAHTAEDEEGNRIDDRTKWQPLADHLRSVAELAAKFAAPFGASDEARLAGLLHDLGKYAARFQQRLNDSSILGVNHWSVGSAEAFVRRALGAAFAIEGHHTGIPAYLENDEETGLECLKERIWKLRSPSASEVNGFPESLDELLARYNAENPTPPKTLADNRSGQDFATALHTRMLFSCLVDADFLDTEVHYNEHQSRLRTTPQLQPERALSLLLTSLSKRSAEGVVNQLRRRLLADCLANAAKPPGLFTLTAPTGSGKTLSGLAFALAHAKAHTKSHGHRRVIVVIPYTSIIEQTASAYRNLFEPEFGPHYVLEHHSAVAPRERKEDTARDAEDERLRRTRLAQENWDAPLVVTTSVQFFESLFGHKPSQCRKLHNIARSVVLFDEVQTLPLKLVPSLLSSVNLLVKDYGVSAVFGTATQPAFAAAAAAIEGGWSPTEISSQPRVMAEALRRTRICRRPDEQRLSWPQLAGELATHRQVLCVVNIRQHAKELFLALRDQATTESDGAAFHLSASMCPAHRHAKLSEIRRRLQAGEPCRLISTQLIEAGVDVDFPRVYRALGPLDSIVQTAGRCNREGLSVEPGEVTVFRPEDHRMARGAYEQAAKISESFLADNPGADLQLPETYAAYFARLYGTLGPQAKADDPAFATSAKLHFPAAARACRLVGEDTRAVIVRWGEGEHLVERFRREKHLSRENWRLAHRFSVSFYQSEFLGGLGRGEIVQPIPDIEFYFWNGHYDADLGVTSPELKDFSL